MRVGMLGAIPYAVAFLAMRFTGWHSDRSCELRWHTAIPLFVTAAGLLGLIHLTGSTPVTVALSTMVCVFMAFLSSFWAIPTEILSESTAAFAVGGNPPFVSSGLSLGAMAITAAVGWRQRRLG